MHGPTLTAIGHSHAANVADAAGAAGADVTVLNFWQLPDALVTQDGVLRLSDAVAARLHGPVFSLVGGAVHQDVGLMAHPRPFDFVWPERPELPLAEGAEVIPFAAVRAALLARTQYFLDIMSAVRAAAPGPVFHMESPPTYWAETLPQDDPGFYHYFGAAPVFSPPWLRWKLWRVHSAIVAAHAAAAGIGFIAHPAEAVDERGFLRAAFAGTPAHANAAYGALVLAQMRQAAISHAAPALPAPIPPSGPCVHQPAEGMIAMQTLTAAPPAMADAGTQAQALADAGDFRAAIAVASEALRRAPDPALARRLIDWRRAGFAAVGHAPARAPWPPALPDPFPGQAGIPVIDRAALTGDLLGGAILHHGSLRVNGLVSRQTAERLRQGIDTALAARTSDDAALAGQFVPLQGDGLEIHRGFTGSDDALAADCPPMHFEMVRAMEDSGVIGCIEQFLGERPSLSVLKSTLRRQPVIKAADWHQDGAFLGSRTRSVNVWLALSPCGADAPGLDVVARRLPYVVETGKHGALLDWSVGPGMIDVLKEGGAAVEAPVFEPGDALVFDHFMLHRTGTRPEMTKMRWAIECWFFAPSFYPMAQVPLLA